ncbi:MAG: PAS domain S-box protein [Deltaproteobacteria bacterium]|nr:PAS domain S-box protein [Deltaproteobacteria bacterium]
MGEGSSDEERFRRLIESVKDYAIFMLDEAGNVASWNAGAQRIQGYAADEIIGAHFSRFYPIEDIRAGKCEMELEVAAREGRFEDEDWRVRKDGSRYWANVIITPIRDERGHLTGFSKVTRDLTERKRSEEERAARLAAEQANRTKDEFLAMLGHELRNPLAPIVSALQLLKLRGDPKSVREVQIIDRQVRQMTRLVDDLLDVSRISRGKLDLTIEPIDLREPLAQAAEIAIPQFESKSQRFEVEVPPRELHVSGDDSRLVQVFANLLNNASRYTPEGGRIVMTVRATGREVVVEVRDDGIGIPPALLPRMFELFVQGDRDVARTEGGLGIGLTLVRSFVELHGGSVSAHSDGPGHGSRFWVRLPSIAAPAAHPPDARADARADERVAAAYGRARLQHRILIVDDNEDARLLLAEVLESLGHHVRTAGDGEAALALLHEYAPDTAILDIGLPGMDGYALAAEIRKVRPAGIVLFALSGYAQPSDVARATAAGFDAHLAKPLDVHDLLDHLERLGAPHADRS